MYAIIRTDQTRTVTIDEQEVTIPWLKLPASTEWRASVTDHGVVRLSFRRSGKVFTAMFIDFGLLGGVPSFVVEVGEGSLPFLKSRLGASNAVRFLVALRNSAAVRARAKDLGFKPVRRAGKIVNVRAPLVTCGKSSIDWNNEDPDTAPEIEGYE